MARSQQVPHSRVLDNLSRMVLNFSDKPIRAWVRLAILLIVQAKRQRSDLAGVHRAFQLVKDLHAAGEVQGLVDEVYRCLTDERWADDEQLQASLQQVERGEKVPVRDSGVSASQCGQDGDLVTFNDARPKRPCCSPPHPLEVSDVYGTLSEAGGLAHG